MVTQERELAETIRFAMKATSNLPEPSRTAMDKLGAEVGHDVARSLASRKRKETYSALVSFWNENGLGRMEVQEGASPRIRLTDCYDCNSVRSSGSKAPCAFKRSLLETILRDSVDSTAGLEELECCRSQGNACVFRLRFE